MTKEKGGNRGVLRWGKKGEVDSFSKVSARPTVGGGKEHSPHQKEKVNIPREHSPENTGARARNRLHGGSAGAAVLVTSRGKKKNQRISREGTRKDCPFKGEVIFDNKTKKSNYPGNLGRGELEGRRDENPSPWLLGAAILMRYNRAELGRGG